MREIERYTYIYGVQGRWCEGVLCRVCISFFGLIFRTIACPVNIYLGMIFSRLLMLFHSFERARFGILCCDWCTLYTACIAKRCTGMRSCTYAFMRHSLAFLRLIFYVYARPDRDEDSTPAVGYNSWGSQPENWMASNSDSRLVRLADGTLSTLRLSMYDKSTLDYDSSRPWSVPF